MYEDGIQVNKQVLFLSQEARVVWQSAEVFAERAKRNTWQREEEKNQFVLVQFSHSQ